MEPNQSLPELPKNLETAPIIVTGTDSLNREEVRSLNNKSDVGNTSSDKKFQSAKLFFILNIFFITTIIVSPLDSYFNFCKFSSGELGSVGASCHPIFFLYGVYVAIVGSLPLFVLMSAFIGFAPVIGLLVWYIVVLKDIFKEEKNELDVRKLKLIKILLVSTILLPFIFAASFALVAWNVSTPERKNASRVSENKKIEEARIAEIVKNNPDYCVDSPENIYISPRKKFVYPELHFPAGYWKGVGVVQISKENSWSGHPGNSEMVHYSSGVTNFPTKNSVSLSGNRMLQDKDSLPDIKIGNKYDVMISILNEDALPKDVLMDKDDNPVKIANTFSFKDGLFVERSAIQFDIGSTTRVTKWGCLTVTVKEPVKFRVNDNIYGSTYLIDNQSYIINLKFPEVEEQILRTGNRITSEGIPIFSDINGDGEIDAIILISLTPSAAPKDRKFYLTAIVSNDTNFKVTNTLFVGDDMFFKKEGEGIRFPELEVDKGDIFVRHFQVNWNNSTTTPEYSNKVILINYNKDKNEISKIDQ